MPLQNLLNRTFGRLTVIGLSGRRDPKRRAYWICKCACGRTKEIIAWSLTSGNTKSCGCLQKEYIRGNINTRADLVGKRFGRLQVVGFSGTRGGKARWLCKCNCGNEKIIDGQSLLRGSTRSCGCITRLENGESSFNTTYRNYEAMAKKRGLEFSLSKDEFRGISEKTCFYCGESPKNISKNKCDKGSFIYNGIDRIENNKGYIKGNVVPCCIMCNKAKNKHSREGFLVWVSRVYEHSVRK